MPRLYHSRVDLAVAEIENLQPSPDTHTHVLVDSWYHCRRVRRAAARRGWDLSGGLKSNRRMRISTAAGGPEWVQLSAYAAGLDDADWAEATWPAQEGGHKVYVHAVRLPGLGARLQSARPSLCSSDARCSTMSPRAAQSETRCMAPRFVIQ